jgi:hypothetical protein
LLRLGPSAGRVGVVLVALHYLLPLDHLAGVPLAVILVVGLLVLLAVAAGQLRLVVRGQVPGYAS